jgi:hypothetical protein
MTLDLCWNLLSSIGNLPNELIIKIVYGFEGIKHPIVMMLLNETRQNQYTTLYNSSFSKKLRKQYYNHGVNDDLLKIMNDNNIDFWICRNYIEYNDPGSFIPRQFGRLYYHILNDNLKVDNYSYIYKFNRYNNDPTFLRRRGKYFPIINNEPINGWAQWEEIRKNIICQCIIRGGIVKISRKRPVCKYCWN